MYDLLRRFFVSGPEQDGTYRNLEDIRKNLAHRNEYILLACMPKSGSTFLLSVLHEVTGFRDGTLCYAYDRSDQDLYLPKLVAFVTTDVIVRQHIRANKPNLELLKCFSIRPVVVVRNLFDTIISLYDHYRNESPISPGILAADHFAELDDETQLDMLVDLMAPWYIGFYVSWYQAKERQEIEMFWTTYEEIIADKPRMVRKVLDFYNINRTDEQIEAAMEAVSQKRTRFNKGITGRGEMGLTESQKARIVNFTRYYPWVDFTPLGIPPAA